MKITRDSEGNILAKQLSKTDIIMKGYLHPLDGCLSSEVTEKQGRLSKNPVKVFANSHFSIQGDFFLLQFHNWLSGRTLVGISLMILPQFFSRSFTATKLSLFTLV